MIDSKDLDKKVLVYHHRFRDFVDKENGTPLEDLDVKGNGIGITTYRKLRIWLKMRNFDIRPTSISKPETNFLADTEFQVTEKELEHKTSTIRQRDLLTEYQLEANPKVNRDTNVASIEVPFKAWNIDRFRTVRIISRTEFKSSRHQAEI